MNQIWIPILAEHMEKLSKGSICLFSLALLRKVYCISSSPRTSAYSFLLDLVLCPCRNLQQCMQALLGITRHQGCSPPLGTTNPLLQRPEGMFFCLFLLVVKHIMSWTRVNKRDFSWKESLTSHQCEISYQQAGWFVWMLSLFCNLKWYCIWNYFSSFCKTSPCTKNPHTFK